MNKAHTDKQPLVEVSQLRKYFPIKRGVFSRTTGFIKAVDGISFNIHRGENFGLVGESGCGKSTIGRTMIRLLEPTSGSMKMDGITVFDVEKGLRLPTGEMQKLRREMQIVFQDPFASLDPRKTVGYIVSEGLLKHKLAPDRQHALRQATEILGLCGMPPNCVTKYPHEFSGGQRQRIGIARALAIHPRFLICDEPIAALDVSIQAQILTLLQEMITHFDLTTLFISHDLGVVKYFCDRIAVMYLGRLCEVGTSRQIFEAPQHPYTHALISAMPRATPDEEKQAILLAGDIPSPADPPSGCRFHTRCPSAMPICIEEVPAQRVIESGHQVWCHLLDM